ncbi:MAG: T9SS type A sorting domain-containing protein [Crocinitomix sp.]|nr:T9SS type A sorting domain-containing protein [Crocinitomix sp.]
MKKIFTILALALAGGAAMAQHVHRGPEHPTFCASTEQTNKVFQFHPEYAIQDSIDQQNMQLEYEHFLETWSPDDRSLYVVPVVVHVVHLGGPENISDEQIYNAIEYLNKDYNKLNSDLALTIPEFAGITGLCNIEFRLATKDPSGQCHPGITRTYSATTYDEGMSDSGHEIVEAVEAVHGNWPQNKYMNIFICIDPAGAEAYTFKPGGWYPAGGMYGSIFIKHDYMGTIGTGGSGGKHTLSHEVGHWLNLSHTWGNSNEPGNPANCGTDDGVADTPNTIGWDNCSNLYGATCGSLDNVQNFMEYSFCSTMFTVGQAAKIQSALTGVTAQRYKLITEANLIATGTNGPGQLCEAKFISNARVICAGGSIDFSDVSYHNVTSRSWTFEGGSPATSALENPTITFNTPGTYNVGLTAFNGGDSEVVLEENYVIVLPETGTSIPYSEGFETLPALPDNNRIFVENPAEDDTWELTTSAASSGSKSAYLGNFGVATGAKDALVSSNIDLSGVDPDDAIIFNFKYAYKRRIATTEEWIRFYISKDCGETWALRKNIKGEDLGPLVSGSAYTPASQEDWIQVDITNILADYYVENFRFKIEFENDNGNNIFIDDINLYPASMTALEDLDNNFGLIVYPNPVADETTIQLNGIAGENYSIAVYNTLGEQIATVYTGELNDGINLISWSTNDLAKGVYVLKIESQTSVQTIKLIKE